MPNKHAALKDLRKNKRRAARNTRSKLHVRNLVKGAKSLLTEKKVADVKKSIHSIQQALDKAAKKGVISLQKANRKKAALMKAVAKA